MSNSKTVESRAQLKRREFYRLVVRELVDELNLDCFTAIGLDQDLHWISLSVRTNGQVVFMDYQHMEAV